LGWKQYRRSDRWDGIAGKNISMPMLGVRLSRYLRRPVVDQTGLKGTFDFQFDIANDQPVDDVVPSIVTSMRGIGLMLKTGRCASRDHHYRSCRQAF